MGEAHIVVVLILHLVTLVFGVVVTITGENQTKTKNKICGFYRSSPLYTLGFVIMGLSFMSLCRMCCSMKLQRWLYLLGILAALYNIALKMWFGVLIIWHVPQNEDNNPIKEVRLSDYSPWIQQRFNNQWSDIKACFVKSEFCQGHTDRSISLIMGNQPIVDPAASANLHPLQRGCCLPPPVCGYVPLNDTYGWYHVAPPAAAPPSANRFHNGASDDCHKWSNKQCELCYNCDTCKAGFIVQFVRVWWTNNLWELGLFTCLILVLCIALRITYSHDSDDNFYDEEESVG